MHRKVEQSDADMRHFVQSFDAVQFYLFNSVFVLANLRH